MAELAALLTRLPDTVLDQFRDAARPGPLTFHSTPADVSQSFTANFRTKNAQLFFDTAWVDLDDQAWLRQRGDLDHLLGPTISERNSTPPVNFDQPRSATPSSGFSFDPYDNYQSPTHSGPGSDFEYLSASGLSTPSYQLWHRQTVQSWVWQSSHADKCIECLEEQ
ncbi:hypothetical protein GGX14DRAFT_392086 [Mycena pura]|uniref:Uncharacterized protein n=1 Tax=Mycena pura TaxID=153505 RepID=A0AAD6VL02_9AGAR|nr:hypothetical protein GGX14DRAFT_392086 [Mycena pura]